MAIINCIIEFFSHPFFIVLGGITALGIVIGFFYTLYLLIKGLFPVWFRLGIGLAKRKIAVFAIDEFSDLQSILVDSKLFPSSNIIEIGKESIKKAESATILLIHWNAFKDELDQILRTKRDSDSLIVYAPQKEGIIDQASLSKINSERNAIIVNFRGRLLNDIFTSMITTCYEKASR
jgi:hypothetical protein